MNTKYQISKLRPKPGASLVRIIYFEKNLYFCVLDMKPESWHNVQQLPDTEYDAT